MDECVKAGVEYRIKHLIEVLNTLPGIFTTSSCGGHEIIENPMQSSADGFNVDLVVDSEKGGRQSLTLITQMAWITGGKNILIIAWHTQSGNPVYSIEGKNNASPDKLAKALEIAIDIQKGRLKAQGKDPFYWWR